MLNKLNDRYPFPHKTPLTSLRYNINDNTVSHFLPSLHFPPFLPFLISHPLRSSNNFSSTPSPPSTSMYSNRRPYNFHHYFLPRFHLWFQPSTKLRLRTRDKNIECHAYLAWFHGPI